MKKTKTVLTCPVCGWYDEYDVRTNGQNSYLNHHSTACSLVSKK